MCGLVSMVKGLRKLKLVLIEKLLRMYFSISIKPIGYDCALIFFFVQLVEGGR